MKEQKKCKKCGLLIDEDSMYCPYCGYQNEEKGSDLDNKKNNLQQNKSNENNNKNNSFFKLLRFEQSIFPLPTNKYLLLFLTGFIGLNLISVILSFIIVGLNPYLAQFTNKGTALLNFAVYLMIIGIMILLLNKDFLPSLAKFKKGRTYLYGFSYGFMLIVLSSLISTLLNLIFSNNSVNNNEAAIDSVTTLYPVLSILIFGIVGPVVEEYAYRVGLFSLLLKKLKPVFVYLIVAIIFGLLHFDFNAFLNVDSLVIELINLPTYIFSGLLLCYFYHKEGFAVSTLAHITNNLFSLIITLLLL